MNLTLVSDTFYPVRHSTHEYIYIYSLFWHTVLLVGEFLYIVFYTRASYTASRSFFAGLFPVVLLDDDARRSVSPIIDGNVHGGALGIALCLFTWSGHSAPTSDHPASISLGTPMGTGVASPAEYFSSLARVAFFILPIMRRASFLDT